MTGAPTPTADERAALLRAAAVLDRLPQVIYGTCVRRGLSQQKAADQMGIPNATFGRWRRGQTWPQKQTDLCILLRWLAADPGDARR